MSKSVVVKVYNQNSKLVGYLTDLSDISFVSSINSGLGELKFNLPRKVDDFGEGTVIEFMNRVEVEISDKESRSQKVYSGYIDTYQPNQNATESITVRCLGYSSLLQETLYRDSNDVTAIFTGTDASVIFQDILDKYKIIHPNSPVEYNSASVESGGGTIDDSYFSLTSLEAIDRLTEKCDSSRYWYIDAENVIHFKTKPSSATHTFVYGRDVIPPFNVSKTVTGVKNRALVYNDNLISRYYTDGVDSEFFSRVERVGDSLLANTTITDQFGSTFVNANNSQIQQIQFRVLDSNSVIGGYDTESIQVGDTFKILNIDEGLVFSDNIQITSIKYSLDYVDIVAEDSRSLTSVGLKDLRRGLQRLQFSSGQPDFTTVTI